MLKDSEVSAGCLGWELDKWGMAECSYKASIVNISSMVASVCALCGDWRWLLCGRSQLLQMPCCLTSRSQVCGQVRVILLMEAPRDFVMLPEPALLPRRLC